jgi:uncharacterized protein
VDIQQHIVSQLNIRPQQVAATIELLDMENTVPFIARYRKEVTGGLDEEQLRHISELLIKLRALDERRQTVLKSIEEQGKLTPELQYEIQTASSMTILEDLYQPYKPKRHTRASVARDNGLQPLAEFILLQPVYPRSTKPAQEYLMELAKPYLNDKVPTIEGAWSGARDIVSEIISDNPSVRGETRQKALQWGSIRSEKIEDAEDSRGVYSLYYESEFRVDRLKPHQVLALNRGEAEKILRLKVTLLEHDWRNAITAVFCPNRLSPLAEQLDLATLDAAERLLLPAIERDVRRELTEKAERHAINVFADNLRALLNQPPLAGHTVMGIDPGYRTGCKVAVIDPTGKVLSTSTIYPHEPQNQSKEALKTLTMLAAEHCVTLIAIGNGTASRETEELATELTRIQPGLKYLIVNEAGASVYSASPLARSELPDLDVSLRGAVSIARRVQDPLAELVKIDPKSIGVGLYQHDVDQKQLVGMLAGVVESVVNRVGVDVNTASPALLTNVSGIGPKLSERIVAYRDEHGPFKNRNVLHEVSGIGPKAFEQSAGFLRIYGGDNPLDASAIHPESYLIADAVMYKAGINITIPPNQRKPALDNLLKRQPLPKLAAELDSGELTLMDILEQLVRPGRDPRQDTPTPILRSDVLKIEDLGVGMRLKGTVRNVVDFGAFIDIGVKQDGLLHRSQIPPGIGLKVGDIIEVKIASVEIERGRIGLGWG